MFCKLYEIWIWIVFAPFAPATTYEWRVSKLGKISVSKRTRALPKTWSRHFSKRFHEGTDDDYHSTGLRLVPGESDFVAVRRIQGKRQNPRPNSRLYPRRYYANCVVFLHFFWWVDTLFNIKVGTSHINLFEYYLSFFLSKLDVHSVRGLNLIFFLISKRRQ